jgi:hypothetical protein
VVQVVMEGPKHYPDSVYCARMNKLQSLFDRSMAIMAALLPIALESGKVSPELASQLRALDPGEYYRPKS